MHTMTEARKGCSATSVHILSMHEYYNGFIGCPLPLICMAWQLNLHCSLYVVILGLQLCFSHYIVQSSSTSTINEFYDLCSAAREIACMLMYR